MGARELPNKVLPPIPDDIAPECRLWAEVIRQAVRDATAFIQRREYEENHIFLMRTRLRDEARAWLRSRDCARLVESLGIEPDYFSRRLLEAVPALGEG